MNGAQDLGGAHGFGPVVPEPDEPVFHAAWEKRVFALAMAMGFTGAWNLDGSRATRESLPPAQYLASSYYEIWLEALERQILGTGLASSYYEIWLEALERQILGTGLATAEEVATGQVTAPAEPVARKLTADILGPRFRAGFPSDRTPDAPARFAVGEAVVAKVMNPVGHTRLPRYVRGRRGRVEAVHGAFVFPDTNAYKAGENPAWLYTVAFEAAELWGPEADPGGRVTIAAFEPYLDPA